jgi:hypothetical protein
MAKLGLSILAAAAALAAVPAVAAPHAAPAHALRPHDNLVRLLKARIANLNTRIDLLRYQGAIGSEEAQELSRQARRLQSRLYGLSVKDTAEVEFAIDRLESRVGFAMDDARWGRRADNGRFEGHIDAGERYERFDRYQADRDYEHFDRYTGSSVDRWHDPFDRGN